MSIGILISVHDGIVLAADSASSLTLLPQEAPGNVGPVTLNVYNNANKIANLHKGLPIGCVAYGSGSIGNASISTLLKDFRMRLSGGEEQDFDPKNYTMEKVATLLLDFLMRHIDALPTEAPKPSIGLLIGGYSSGKSLGEGWKLQIDKGLRKTPELLRKDHEVGVNWGGATEPISRLILGFGTGLPGVLKSIITPTPEPDELRQLIEHLRQNLQAALVFAPMPIQDTIDLAEFLVHTAIMFSRFTPGASSVGGPIEIAAITKHEGFKWVRRKHYFSQGLNPEIAYDDTN